MVKDVQQWVDDQSLTFACLSPNYDIMQAIQKTIGPGITNFIFHVKGHQDQDKQWSELDPCAQMKVLADRQANAIYQKLPEHTGLFPTWVPGTCAALFHDDRQVTLPTYVRSNTPQKCDRT
jgi:hypothetical protein